MKPKKTSKDESKPARPSPARKSAEAAEAERPELEDEDTEITAPDAGIAEAEAEKARERADDDGMPGEDAA